MANWYLTSFNTTDKDIVDIIKHGKTIDFYYDEKSGFGHCRLAWGLGSIDVEKIAEIAEANKSTFHIITEDCFTNSRQEWEFIYGVEVED